MKSLQKWMFIFLLLILILTACGRNRGDSDGASQDDSAGQGAHSPAVFGTTATLNVAAMQMDAFILNSAAERLRRELAEQGVYLQINFSLYQLNTEADWGDYLTSIITRFAAGQGYDLFMHSGQDFPVQAMISDGFLADINPLIEQDPRSGRQDYFTHILEAMEVNGGLYTFPLTFGFDFIGINAELPAEFINRFAGYSAISISQLAAIYNDLQAQHPEFGHLATSFALRHGAALWDTLGSGIDWNIGTIQLEAASLANFLDDLGKSFSYNHRHGIFFEPDMITNPRGTEMMRMMTERFVFSNHRTNLDPVNAFLPLVNPYFIHYIPLLSEDGNLAAWDATLNMYSISSTANGAMAWAFLRHLVEARSEGFHREISMQIPIARHLFQGHMESAIRTALNEPAIQPFEGQGNYSAEEVLIAGIISRLETYLTMPVSSLKTRILMPTYVFNDVYNQLLLEGKAAGDTATSLIANVNDWLYRKHELVMDTQAVQELEAEAAAEAARADMYVRTLSVFANREYANILWQAAQDINRAWTRQGREYRFELNLTTYDWEDWEAVQTRVQTMLMAGQGYDLMFADWFMPYRTFAESGFLTDIYTLIDQDPVRSRDDFFTNVLEAFEVNGGLYGFPLSFGFEWVGISNNLPQTLIDRFAQYDRISTGSMLSIYSDMLAAYGNDFGHMNIGQQQFIGTPNVALGNVINSFIDFEARTADFTSPRFINFLEDLKATFYGRMGFIETITGSMSNMWNVSELRAMANRYVFHFDVNDSNPANALFIPDTPIFAHFIPVSDENGRFRVRQTGDPVWATLYFPVVGDSTLAWEFTHYLIEAFINPRGAAATNLWGSPQWGGNSFAIPITRAYFDRQINQAIERALSFIFSFTFNSQTFPGITENFEQTIADVINRIKTYINDPFVMPESLPSSIALQNRTDVENFTLGLITAQVAAQNIQNRVALWLIE